MIQKEQETLLILSKNLKHKVTSNIIGSRFHSSRQLRNLAESSLPYDTRHIRADEIGKCLDEGLEQTYFFSIYY